MELLRKCDFFTGKKNRPIDQEKVITVVLRYNAHCKHCICAMKKCCENMEGVLSAELDEKDPGLITVKGVFEQKKLVAHIRRKVEKIVTVIKEESAAGEGGGGGGEGQEEGEAAGEGSGGGADEKIEEEEEEEGEGEIRVVRERE